MKYNESLFLRKRTLHLDKYGITIEDSGLFRTINRFIKLENITPKYNFHKEHVIDKVVLSFSLLCLSIYIFIKQNNDLIFLIMATILGLFSLFIITDIIKNSKYKGTLYFDKNPSTKDGMLYFKTNYPINNELERFIEKIRENKISSEYENILNNNYHQSTQEHFNNNLNNLKGKLFLSDEEFIQLDKKLKVFFQENEIPESY